MSATAATKNGGSSSPGHSGAAAGGVSPSDPQNAPTGKAKIVNGFAVAPVDAPPEVKKMIEAANEIAKMPYRYGGGHGSFKDTGYDCSGAISYALNGADADLIDAPLDSSSFMSWGKPGKGKWVTVYTNPGHAFIMIAGLRFDTGFRSNNVRGTHPGKGPRWGKKRPTRGFVARHPDGL